MSPKKIKIWSSIIMIIGAVMVAFDSVSELGALMLVIGFALFVIGRMAE